MTNKTIVVALLVVSLAAVACGKKKADPEKYAEFCAELVKCDKSMQTQATGLDLCKQSMVKLEEKMAAAVPPLQDCVKSQKCEKKSLMGCFAQVMQQQGVSIPNQ